MAGRVAETKIDKLEGAGEMEDVHVCIMKLCSYYHHRKSWVFRNVRYIIMFGSN